MNYHSMFPQSFSPFSLTPSHHVMSMEIQTFISLQGGKMTLSIQGDRLLRLQVSLEKKGEVREYTYHFTIELKRISIYLHQDCNI
jgi:hypothetical protein